MPKGIRVTKEELSRRRGEIFNAAKHLFVEKGFNETSMREIAEVAKVGKSTLYDYFSSKDEVLIYYVLEEVNLMTALAKEIIAGDSSVSDKFQSIMLKQMEHMLENKQIYLKLTFEAQRLSYDSQQHIQIHRHAYQDMLCDLIREGIRSR